MRQVKNFGAIQPGSSLARFTGDCDSVRTLTSGYRRRPPSTGPASRAEKQDRSGWWRAALCVLAVTLSCSPSRAQRLNLDAPSAPPAGANDSTRAMKAALPHAGIGSPEDPLPDSELGAAARERLQGIALALILQGEELGEPGSVHIAAAMTLLADLSWPSAISARASQPGGEVHAAALRIFIRGIDRLPDRKATLPESAAELDVYLREIFAPLTEALRPAEPPLMCGWVAADASRTAPTCDELRTLIDAAAEMDPAVRAALKDLLAVLAEADATWSFAAAAADARRIVAGALPVATGGKGGLPAWFAESQRALVVERISAALRAFAASTRDDEAAESLALAASIARMCAWADTLQAGSGGAGQGARDIQSIRLALADAAADSLGEPGPARDRARKSIRALERTLDLLDERASHGSDADVAQSLRTSFRALDAAAKKSEAQLIAQIAEIARAESASSQPAIVSVIAAHRRSLDDLKMLRLVDSLLTKHRDDQSPTWRLVSSRLTRLGQEVSKPATMETALLDLRAFAAAMELQEPFVGEPAIRAAAAKDPALPAWDAESIAKLTGNQAAAVVARIDELRAAYLEAWSRAGDDRRSGVAPNAAQDPEAIAARLRNLRLLCGTIEDIRVLRALGVPEHRAKREGLLAWRGLPISAFTAEWLSGGDEMTRLVADAATQAMDDSPAAVDRARAALRRIESENPTRRLVARLDREARARGIVAVPPYASLAAPPTRGAWMAGERARLAAIARYLDEAAAAANSGGQRDAAAVMRYVEMVAGEVGG